MRTIGLLALLLVALAVAAGLSACGGDGSGTPEERLCSALADFETSLDALTGMDIASTSADEARRAVGDVVDSSKEVANAAKDVSTVDVSDLRAAAASLETSLENFPSLESIQALSTAIGTIGESGQQALDDLNCNENS